MFNSQFPILIRVEGARFSFLSDENWELNMDQILFWNEFCFAANR
jgi:hypothetical protein